MHCRFVFSSGLPPKTISVLVAASLRHVAYWLFATRVACNEFAWRAE